MTRCPSTARLLVALVAGWLVYRALLLWNPGLGVFALLALADLGIAVLAALVFAVRAIRARERCRWVAHAYVLLVTAGAIWAAVDM